MNSKRSSRRQFLQRAAAAGLAAGAVGSASAQSRGVATKPEAKPMLAEASRFPFSGLEVAKRIDHITYYTPIQDSAGIITPAPLHFMQTHASEIPDLDPKEHRLTIHGMVERPLSFTLDELKRLPSVSRIHFVECHGNGSPARHSDHEKKGSGVPIQFVHGMTSCSEWTGVLLSVLLKEAGVKKEASWLVYEGGDPGKYTYTLPLAKAMDDVMVAYAQNGEPVRPAQGHPLRMLVPGWEGPFSVKWLKHIKVVDQPYFTWNESMNHSIPRPDLGGKSRWHHFQMAPKSVITRPSSGHTLPGPGFYEITGLAWSGYGAVRRVEISIDGGKAWKDARLQAPILRMAHTRFNFDWNWDGQETLIQSRCTDDQGETQLSVAELYKNWGYTDYKSQDKSRAIHFNAIQPWRIAKDGSVYDAMFD
jgi:sulfane dehydrogenase subunit SoxC